MKLKQNGYAHALNALGGSQNQKVEYTKAWMPDNSQSMPITWNFTMEAWKSLGNRESDFQANFNTSKYRVSYKYISANMVQEKYTFTAKL